MGVDSGLPDFRGNHGFWKAYPAYDRLGLSFAECATPRHFADDPHFAWGFYGHRTNLYRNTIPHDGFHIIKKWIEKNSADTLWSPPMLMDSSRKQDMQRSRCLRFTVPFTGCSVRGVATIEFGATRRYSRSMRLPMRACDPIPHCAACGRVSRPNILMFGDSSWLQERVIEQNHAF